MSNNYSSIDMHRDKRNEDFGREESHTIRNSHFGENGRVEEPPSKVVHIGRIVPTATDREIIAMAVPFGKIVNFVTIRAKDQALLEFDSLDCAIDFMRFARSRKMRVRGHPVSIRFSIHDTILSRVPEENEYADIYLEYALTKPSAVLRASVKSHFRISFSDFETLFFQFGDILRMIVFDKGPFTQALVEMCDIPSAIIAKISLNGQNVFCDGAIIRVDFGIRSGIEIKSDGDRCRDYTKNPKRYSNNTHSSRDRRDRDYEPEERYSRKRKHDETKPYEDDFQQDHRMERSFVPPQFNDARHHNPPQHEDYRRRSPSNNDNYRRRSRSPYDDYRRRSPSPFYDYRRHNSSRFDDYREYSPPRDKAYSDTRKVILIDNLPDDITCDMLYNFVGYYGDVKIVKILFKKKSSALIQMETSSMAENVVRFLNKIQFDEKELHVKFSNFSNISLPHNIDENYHLTKDYTDSKLKRYKRPDSKNYRHIYPPSTVLHLCNTSQLSHDEIKELFLKIAQVEVKTVESLKTSFGQVLVGLKTITDAIYGIMKLHNYILPNSKELKVSFSSKFSKQNNP